MTVIDGFAHFIPKGYVKAARAACDQISKAGARNELARYINTIEQRPHFVDLNERLRVLDDYGIDRQVTAIDPSLDPNIQHLEDVLKMNLCKKLNDEMAQVNKDSKGKILTLGSVNLSTTAKENESELAFEEMRRAVQNLGLRGFVIPSNIQGRPVDAFSDFWNEVEKLGIAVYIHPAEPITKSSRPYEDEYDLAHTFGWPFETTLALARLVFSGTMSRHPRLRILGHHLGGMIPYYAGRIDETYSSKNASPRQAQWTTNLGGKSIIEAFRSFYYDTAVGGSTSTIKLGLEVFGVDRVVFSTDYPFGPDSGRVRLATYVGKVRDLGLAPQENAKIFEENVLELLGV